MRKRLVHGLGIGVTAAALAIAAAPAALATGSSPVAYAQTRPHQLDAPAAGTCYDQTSGDTGAGWISSKFGDDHTFDNQGADDFTLTKRCVVTEVLAAGTFPGTPASSVNVVFYADNDGVPGRAVHRGKEMKNTYTWSALGTLDITLKHKLRLRPGTYWVSIQPNVADGSNDWLWNTVGTQTGSPAMWKNPRDGFQLGCQTYAPLADCALFQTGPDDSFAILSS